ncbi:M13 family metallopeptidase [uncultured Acetobacteroides sp.]|uniref:M13 family metallopeptidase n=1 Tax=uncultured Acetobacteroides sp. TaxID=1760811 RepID=UPI0029F5698C|nr:M13 family metallopeptidase [uncultured Acetobacteroides sp.]
MQIKSFTKPLIILAAIGLIAVSCSKKKGESKDLLLSTMDTTVNPGDDFFKYANGLWIKNNPIPAAYSRWGIGNVINDEIYDRLRTINESSLKEGGTKGSNTQKIGDFWYSGMDTVSIEKEKLNPLKADLNRIARMKSTADVLAEVAYLHTLGMQPLFAMYAGQDQKNSDVIALYLEQGGIGLPDRDYFFNTDKHTADVRKDYQNAYLVNMCKLSGINPQQATGVYKLEEGLAKASRKLEALRDPYKNYNKMSIAQLNKLTPGVDWAKMLPAMKVKKVDSVIVGQPEFLKQVAANLKSASIDTWKAYLTLNLLNEYAAYMHKDINKENFRFYGTVLSGAKEQRPRWKRVLSAEEGAMGEILGQLFVKEYFPARTKKRYEDMVENVKTAFGERIKKLDWMSQSTKEKALAKLAKVSKKVGYPDKWKDFSSLRVDRGPFVLNMKRAGEFWYAYNINKLGKPVDRTEWDMTPQTYNAYYNPSNNEIVLPAAIFSIPGWNDDDIDDAIVYGYAAASTIGHEMTHGFDDQGCQYNEKGNLVKWWTPVDEKNFADRTKKIVTQFNNFVVLDSVHVNGEASQGENIADLGGIVIAWDAFTKTKQYKEGKKINGLTPAQRYFLGYALGWLGHQRDEALANQIMTDVHAPANLRVNGPFSNVDAFYDAFNVKPGNKMYVPAKDRIKIW